MKDLVGGVLLQTNKMVTIELLPDGQLRFVIPDGMRRSAAMAWMIQCAAALSAEADATLAAVEQAHNAAILSQMQLVGGGN